MLVLSRAAPGPIIAIPDTDWKTYTRLLRVFADRPGVRLAFDRGVLEIMSPQLRHDRPADFLGLLVRILAEELGLPIMGGGSTTLRRQRKQRGIEPDRCYWIVNEPAVRGLLDLDLRVHPPPDLAIEVDVASSSLNRMGIYAALGVSEVWRLSGPALTFHALATPGHYQLITHSAAFTQVTPADLMPYLDQLERRGENDIIRDFRAWVRQLPPTATAKP